MNDSAKTIAVYLEAEQRNHEDPLLEGSLLRFPDYGQLVMTGDLHGHRRNFSKLNRYCDLKHFGARHVIVHELIHEEPVNYDAPDMSHELLFEAAEWKCAFPDQVHFLCGNHELAQICGQEISKNGRIVTRDFEEGIRCSYGSASEDVLDALYRFIRSFPLAGRTPNRVFLSHSLPGPRELPTFDVGVFSRVPNDADRSERGSVHSLVWGRYHTKQMLISLRDMLDTDFFLCGHQPQEMGYEIVHDCMVILASDHNHGVFLPLDLGKPVSLEILARNIRPFAAVA